uniref:Uncharacterized protein n=1 Tax=Rhizophora mucronata TaxID=61149 RepID=A0A2P2Q7R1_RHIMU
MYVCMYVLPFLSVTVRVENIANSSMDRSGLVSLSLERNRVGLSCPLIERQRQIGGARSEVQCRAAHPKSNGNTNIPISHEFSVCQLLC